MKDQLTRTEMAMKINQEVIRLEGAYPPDLGMTKSQVQRKIRALKNKIRKIMEN